MGPANAVDLLVLFGDRGQSLGTAVGEFVDRLLRLIQPFLELGDFRFEPVGLGFAGIRYFSGLSQGLEVPLNSTRMGVGTGAVIRGAVDYGLVGQSSQGSR
ncbi:hypothetical protein [Streptomyces lydicus]|uniref:hypothetical protein n=1 Tax=Streptomyces lydicus TaxID=47763 RepID=UPI0036F0C912